MKDVGNLNRPSDSCENAKKSGLEKMAKGRGQGEMAKGPPTLSHLLSSMFVFLRSPFRATVHYPLSQKRVKMFSETFVTTYPYKRDSNTSKRTCILTHNYLKEKTRKKKKVF